MGGERDGRRGEPARERQGEDIRQLYAQMKGNPSDAALEESDLGPNGIQWQNVAPLLGMFVASAAIAFALGDSSLPLEARTLSALNSAGLIFIGTLVTLWFFSRFVHHSRLSSRVLVLLVWAAAMAVWLLSRLH
jgi:hypothetical protein